MALKFSTAKSTVPVFFLIGDGQAAKAGLPERARRALQGGHFKPAPGRHHIVQGDDARKPLGQTSDFKPRRHHAARPAAR